MTQEELLHIGRALTTAHEAMLAYLGEALPESQPPEVVLASIEDQKEVIQVGLDWIKEAEEELARRQQLVQEDRERRLTMKGYR